MSARVRENAQPSSARDFLPQYRRIPNPRRRIHMARELDGMRVAILATDGFELSELTEPKRALEEAGAEVDVLAPAKSAPSRQGSDCPDNEIQGVKHHIKAGRVRIDGLIADADPEDYDAVHLPG